jgi:hypothetical protein
VIFFDTKNIDKLFGQRVIFLGASIIFFSTLGIQIGVANAEENAIHAKCQIRVRLIRAVKEAVAKGKKVSADVPSDDSEQLQALPFGSYRTVDEKSAETSSFTPANFILSSGSQNKDFSVVVTPNSLADNKVHYTLEWKAPGEQSVVATRLGVENGRCVMIGADLSSEIKSGKKVKNDQCFIIGVNVTCGAA